VEAEYKGDLDESVTVTTRHSSAACGYDDGLETFEKGTVWAIYANEDEAGVHSTDSLSLNTEYDSVDEAEDALADLGITVEDDEPTMSAPPTRDLWQGMRHADVSWLQDFLIRRLQGPAADALRAVGATGYFGELTRAAVAEFQNARGIAPAHGYFGAKTRAALTPSMPPAHDNDAETVTFEGEIEAVSTACFYDAVCSVTIDGNVVVLLAGLRMDPPPVGSLIGVDSIGDLEDEIGSKAKVYAAIVEDDSDADYTLYGSTKYYVEVLK
jgi:peptidoglycan hydrolase-like protein with peptidoglycan-binding domain